MTETILLIISIVSCICAAYFFAVSRERLKTIDNLSETIQNQKQDLRQWQNKLLPSPLGSEMRERKPKSDKEPNHDKSPIPKILTRAEINERLEEDDRMYQRPLKYQQLATKAKQLVERNR